MKRNRKESLGNPQNHKAFQAGNYLWSYKMLRTKENKEVKQAKGEKEDRGKERQKESE